MPPRASILLPLANAGGYRAKRRFAVDSRHAEGNYALPTQFFQITYITEGLRRVLTTAAQRLSGVGGDPVIGLQTAFGGGKTHTMLALYPLARYARDGGDPRASETLV